MSSGPELSFRFRFHALDYPLKIVSTDGGEGECSVLGLWRMEGDEEKDEKCDFGKRVAVR
jgi:hypothetical protein